MPMRTVAMSELAKPVRSFLSRVRKGNGILVHDDDGRPWCGVIPYDEVPSKEQAAALSRVARIQRKVGRTMAKKGRTEAQFDRLLRNKS
jgi:hypothetical protein